MPTPTARKRKEKKAQVLSSDLLRMWPWGEPEYKFHATRKWAIDWVDTEMRFGVELDGYVYHTLRGKWLGDMEKHNAARLEGWIVLHITPDMFRNGDADALLRGLYEYHVGVGGYPRDN